MKPRFLFVLAYALSIPPLAGIGGDVQQKKANKVEEVISQKGVIMKVTIPARSRPGGPVNATVRIANDSKTDVVFTAMEKYGDYDEVRVVDSKGNAVPLTRFGKLVYGDRRFGRDGSSSLILSTLKPGDRREDVLNLARVFDLTLPGEYSLTITAKVKARETLALTAPNMKFEVTEER